MKAWIDHWTPASPFAKTFKALSEAENYLSEVISPAQFRSSAQPLGPVYVEAINFKSLSLALIKFNSAARIRAENPNDDVALGFCLNGSMAAEIDGMKFRLEAGQGLIMRPQSHIELDLSEDCIRLIARVHPRVMRTGWEPGLVRRANLEDESFQPFWEIIQALIGSSSLVSAVHQSEQISDNLEMLLISLLNELHLEPCQHSASTVGVVSRDVKRAIQYIRSHFNEEVTLLNMSEKCGVSPRTLQANFARFCGYTPMEFLKEFRLHKVRTELSRHAFSGSVSGAALENGFNHLGRFAEQYRKKYGESPSETLRARRDATRQ